MPVFNSIANRKFIVAILFLSLVVTSAKFFPAYSTTPLEQAQIDYSYQLTKYQDAKTKFDRLYANYTTYKTSIAKNDLFQETKDYYNQICDLYIAYFLLVNERSNSITWESSSYKKDDQYKLLTDEITSIQNIKKNAQNVQKLEDFNSLFKDLNDNITKTGLPTANFVLKTTDVVQIEAVAANFNKTVDTLDQYAKSKIKDNNKNLYEDWKSKIDTSKKTIQDEVDADKKFLILYTSPTNAATATFTPDNPNAQNIFNQTKELLREILKYV